MWLDEVNSYNIILASHSPRRSEILKDAGIHFKAVIYQDTDETFPHQLKNEAVAIYLAKKKATVNKPFINKEDILITADTIVVYEDQILNKPLTEREAIEMLQLLSGKTHKVYTGVCLLHNELYYPFYEVTRVTFSSLANDEIQYYIHTYKPFDKAGAYGIQEWIGYTGIQGIEGCYYNVMGLPVFKLIVELKSLLKQTGNEN